MAALIAPLFALALPIVDVALAILRRGLKGLPLFRPDRKHIHHKLQDLGLSRTRTVLILYGFSLVFLLLAFGVFWSQGRLVPILFGFLCLILMLSARSFKFSRDWFAVGRVLENSLELRKQTHYALALANWLELEAERATSPEALWDDYIFALRKMRFLGVKLTMPDGSRSWRSGEPCHHPMTRAHELHVDGPVQLEFTVCMDEMSPRVCEHLSELAAEAWLKAAQRYRASHPQPFRFPASPEPLSAAT
jgi:UDP-GlcNAc:undecaprenyl-phosphate GlcNAc-1-phosphate transferase